MQETVSTSEVIRLLKANSGKVMEFEHWLGGKHFLTHWMFYDRYTKTIKDSYDKEEYWEETEEELLNCHASNIWINWN